MKTSLALLNTFAAAITVTAILTTGNSWGWFIIALIAGDVPLLFIVSFIAFVFLLMLLPFSVIAGWLIAVKKTPNRIWKPLAFSSIPLYLMMIWTFVQPQAWLEFFLSRLRLSEFFFFYKLPILYTGAIIALLVYLSLRWLYKNRSKS